MALSPRGLPQVEGLQKVLENADDAVQTPTITDKDLTETTPVQDEAAQQKQVEAPLKDGQAQQMTDEEVLAQFKSTKDLLKSYKEIQGYTTRVSQENKALKDKTAELEENLKQLKEEIEIRNYQAPAQQQQGNQKTFEELFVENPEQALEMKAMQVANTQRVAEVLEEEKLANPSKFSERVKEMRELLSDNPQMRPLSYSPKGVKKLFEFADKSLKEKVAKRAREFMDFLTEQGIDIRTLANNSTQTQTTTANPLDAYMPTTRTTTRTGADVDIPLNELERAKQEAIKTGDASKVAGVLIKQALLK